jgi:hypothetical protein
MIIFLLTLGLVLSLGLNIATFILVKTLLKKISVYEEYILNFKSSVMSTLGKMREIDTKGTFASGVNDDGKFAADDEVGQVFKELGKLLEDLNKLIE